MYVDQYQMSLREKLEEKGVDVFARFLNAQGNLWKYRGCDSYVPSTITLHPYQIYESDFQQLRSANSIWAKLFIKMSEDFSIIQALHKNSTDPMIKNLLRIAKKSSQKQFQKIKAIFFRNDYLYNDDSKSFQQTQINLISAGLWTKSEKAQKFHQMVNTMTQSKWKLYYEPSSIKVIDFYIKLLQQYQKQFPQSKPHMLKIAEGDGGCGIQQTEIEKQLLLRGHILICGTFTNLLDRMKYSEETGKVFVDNRQIGVVYYRNGYMNDHYPDENSWKVRQILECSRAIKIPNANIQLVNFKSAQALIQTTDIIKKYLDFDQINTIDKLQTKIWSPEQIKTNLQSIIKNFSNKIVVKSIHEGSEQNYFYQKAHQVLRNNNPENYLVMQLIRSKSRPVLTLKMGKEMKEWNGVSQLGLYSSAIYNQTQIIENKYISYTVRTYQDGVGQVHTSYGTKGIDSLAFK